MQTTTRRTLRIITGSVIVIAVIAVAIFYFLKKDLAKPPGKSLVKPILADGLKKMVTEASDSLYHLEFSFFDINTEAGTGIIKDMKLVPDSNVYQRLVLSKKAPNSVLTMSIDSAVISHFAFEKTGDGRKLVMDDIIIQNPFITIDYAVQPYSDSIDIKEEKTLLKTIKDLMKLSSIQNITMRNLNLTMSNRNGKETRKTSLKHLNLTTSGINVLTVKTNDSSKKEQTAVSITSSRMATPDSLYYLQTKEMHYLPESNTITVAKMELEPRLTKDAFYKQAKFRKDRYHFVQNNVVCKEIDWDKLIRKQQVHIQSMTVGSSYSEVYTNYEYPKRKPPVRNHGDPHVRLQKLAFDITIDTMYMHNGTTEYAMKGDKGEDVAVFKIDKQESVVTNITNNAEAKARNHFTTNVMTGRLMEGGPVSGTMRFDLADKDGAFTLTTTLGAMDGKLMNPVTKPLALMEIQSLDIQKMVTTIHGNAYRGKGNIDLYYKNMKIALLKKKDDDYKKKGLLSFVSNLFTPDDNPNKKGKFKKGPIDIKRNPTDSFFGFLWECNLKGMAVHMTGLDKK